MRGLRPVFDQPVIAAVTRQGTLVWSDRRRRRMSMVHALRHRRRARGTALPRARRSRRRIRAGDFSRTTLRRHALSSVVAIPLSLWRKAAEGVIILGEPRPPIPSSFLSRSTGLDVVLSRLTP